MNEKPVYQMSFLEKSKIRRAIDEQLQKAHKEASLHGSDRLKTHLKDYSIAVEAKLNQIFRGPPQYARPEAEYLLGAVEGVVKRIVLRNGRKDEL